MEGVPRWVAVWEVPVVPAEVVRSVRWAAAVPQWVAVWGALVVPAAVARWGALVVPAAMAAAPAVMEADIAKPVWSVFIPTVQ